jgi:hypothetical protein
MNMHWCTGKINLSGQGFMVLIVDPLEPISWPEAQVIMALHGEENVYELKPVVISDTSAVDEKNRLLGKYGKVVERVFPGRSPRMEMEMPGEYGALPVCDNEGRRIVTVASNGHPTPPQPGDDDEEDDDAAVKPPEPAVFKPGKHTPPHKGV